MNTNYSLLMEQRLACFREILKALPEPRELPAELLIMSGGERTGHWSYRHVFTTGDTLHFIFRKAGLADGKAIYWECVDRELDELMQLAQAA